MVSSPPPRPARRFLIIGLPRSGTTYLMTLLNAHPSVLCGGELFNPYAIIGPTDEIRDYSSILARDKTPRVHAHTFFREHADFGYDCLGYKLMIGHNLRVLRELPDLPNYHLIYVHRHNKLAQVSSLIKADTTQRWAQMQEDAHISQKIDVTPQRISQYWHELATQDFLFSEWFKTLPQKKKWQLEYRAMFRDGFEQRLCDFLGIPFNKRMKSPLVKQGTNTILDRFEKPGPIRDYFQALDLQAWLEPEI